MNMNWFNKGNQALSDPVTQASMQFKFPTRGDLDKQTGYPRNRAIHVSYFLMYATAFRMLDYSDYHQATHYGDSATTANAREKSGFKLYPQEMGLEFHHDIPEDVSTLIVPPGMDQFRVHAAYALMDLWSRLLMPYFGPETRRVLDLRTNVGNKMLDPVVEPYEKIQKANPHAKINVAVSDVTDRMKATYGNLRLTDDVRLGFYDGLIRRWQEVSRVLSEPLTDYLPQKEKDYTKGVVDAFIRRTQEAVSKGNIPTAPELEKRVQDEFDKTMAAISNEQTLEQINQKFLLDTQIEVILRMKKTLYRHYIERMNSAVLNEAKKVYADPGTASNAMRDSYLYPSLGKKSDARDSATRMGPKMENITSQFRKYRLILEQDTILLGTMRSQGWDYTRMWHADNFLLESFVDGLKKMEANYREVAQSQTQLKGALGLLEQMVQLMEQFKPLQGLKPKTRFKFGTSPLVLF